MDLRELIEKAAERAGTSAALAGELGMHQNRLAEWKKGKRRPDANEIAFLAKTAGLPILETVAEIEAQLDNRFTAVWREALGKLKAAGVAAVLVLASLPHQEAKAGVLQLQNMHTLRSTMPICSVLCCSNCRM
ncbi:MAG: helix-turn-helix domain-containing protein [Acidobacteriaceae bacterium]